MQYNKYRQIRTNESQSIDHHDFIQESSSQILASERVNQLKKEIEDLDNKLMSTNTINFQEIKNSIRHQTLSDNQMGSNHFENDDAFTSEEEEQYHQYGESQGKYATLSNQSYEIEDKIIRQEREMDSKNSLLHKNAKYGIHYDKGSKMSTINDRKSYDFQSSIPQNKSQQNQGKREHRNQNFIDTSHISHEGEVSFDLEKIYQKRNENIKTAFESNLKEKEDLINNLEQKLNTIKKDCDAKTLKLAHLKYERDNIINQIQIDDIKKKEIQKEVTDQQKRIEIKRKEDERAYNLAQNEIKRCILLQESSIQHYCEKADLLSQKLKDSQKCIIEQNKMYSSQSGASNELDERINQQKQKIASLHAKRQDVENNVQILRDFLKQISEEIQMTQEDLGGKLMQRAEFVAQREELDQMYESGKKAFGRSFEIFLKVKDISNSTGNLHSARYLDEEYESAKAQSFFVDILQQLRSSCKSKFYEKINLIQQKIEQESNLLDLDKCVSMITNLSKSLGIMIDKNILLQKLEQSSQEKDRLFDKRQIQLLEIINEIKRFEKLIKENSNLVDNMILPQLKAMSTTYNEHKNKYKKLKQASFVLKERIKKADKDQEQLIEERNKFQSQSHLGSQIKQIEMESVLLTERISQEQQEMDRLNENASQIEKEFRRAQQTLLLKERELMRKYANNNIKGFSGTQSQLMNSQALKQEHDYERNKKKFIEIEDKIKSTLKDKEDAFKKHYDFQRLLREAQDSLNHAQQMMISTQRIIENTSCSISAKQSAPNNYNTLPNNRRHYQQQKKQNNQEDFQDEYQMTSVTDSEQDSTSNLESSSKLANKNNILNNLNQSNHSRSVHLKSNSMAFDGSQKKQFGNQCDKENGQAQKRRQSIGKIDLTKALAYRDNLQSLDEPEIIKQPQSDKNSGANSYYNREAHKMQNSLQKYDSESNSRTKYYQENNNKIQNQEMTKKFCSKNATAGSDYKHLGEDIINILQQSNFLNDSQTNTSNLSILNLSDLLMNNNAIQNLLNLACTQESRSTNQLTQSLLVKNDDGIKPFSHLTFNNTQNDQNQQYQNFQQTQTQNMNKFENSSLQDSNLSEQNTLLQSQNSYNQRQSSQGQRNQYIDSDARFKQNTNDYSKQLYENTEDNIQKNQNNIVDLSLIQCLNEINNGINQLPDYERDERLKRQYMILKRSSIDTADFFQNQHDQKQAQTIEYETRGMQQLHSRKIPQGHLSPVIKGERQKFLQQSQNTNYQQQQSINPLELRFSQQNPLKNNEFNQKSQIKNNWMSKYLSNANDSSRMGFLQESISPKPIANRQQKLRFIQGQNFPRNRSNSQEQKFNGNNKMNMSINSVNSSMNFNSVHNQSCIDQLNRSNSRGMTRKNRKLNKSLNNVDSSMILQQSINSSLINPVTMSLNFQNFSGLKNGSNHNHHQNSCFANFNGNQDQDFLQFSKIEVLFAERIVPLLDGAAFYKKFSSRQSLNENAFDPLNADKFPPETCGYGIRLFQLDKSLMCINIRQSLKNAVENTISLNDIVKPILPQTTMDIIKAQKQFSLHQQASQLRRSSRNGILCANSGQGNNGQSCASSTKDLLEEYLILDTKGSISHLAKIGIVNKNSELYRQKCLDSTYYPFSIALTKGRVELIATSYDTLKNWIIGINLLVSNKKHIPKIRQMMDIRLD